MAAAGLVTVNRQQLRMGLIENIETTLILHEVNDMYTLMAKQWINSPIVLSGYVMPSNGTNGPRFEFTVQAGGNTFKEAAELLAINLGLEKRSFIYLKLADYNARIVMDLIDAFETLIN